MALPADDDRVDHLNDRLTTEVRLTPVYFNDDAQPEPLVGIERHEQVVSLIEDMRQEIGTTIVRDGDDALVMLEKERDIDTRDWVRRRGGSYPRLARLLVDPAGAGLPVAPVGLQA